MKVKKTCISLLLILCSMMFVGCPATLWLLGGAAVGVGTYVYLNGELERKYPVGFETAWQASVTTLEQLQFTKENSKRDGIDGNLDARRADGTPVNMTFKLLSDRVTSIKVKVGFMGDRQISERIHERIRENLGLK